MAKPKDKNKFPEWRFTEIPFLEAMAMLEDESRKKDLYFETSSGAIDQVVNYRGSYNKLPIYRYFRRDVLDTDVDADADADADE